jgi:hypothetical protein
LIFIESPIQAVATYLSRHFQEEFYLSPEVSLELKITATYENNNLIEVTEELEVIAQLSIQKKNSGYLILLSVDSNIEGGFGVFGGIASYTDIIYYDIYSRNKKRRISRFAFSVMLQSQRRLVFLFIVLFFFVVLFVRFF